MGKKSAMNIPGHISESLEQFLRLKILKVFDADPGSQLFLPWTQDRKMLIREKHPGSPTLPVKGIAAGVYQI
jgi:hypothetical protein